MPEINKNLDEIRPSATLYSHFGKRAIDIVVSSCALAVTLPINLVLAAVTFFDVGSPIFFVQERIGIDGKHFTMIKFRNMTNETNEEGELLPASERVTKWGSFARKTSLDELLNFWSVLKGDMSVIGPRPLPEEYLYRYNKRHRGRLSVRPGLECPPRQRLGHILTWNEQFENDVWYAENISFRTNALMLFNLVRFAFDRKMANARANVKEKGTFMGYDEDGIAINLEEVPQEIIDALFEDDSRQ